MSFVNINDSTKINMIFIKPTTLGVDARFCEALEKIIFNEKK